MKYYVSVAERSVEVEVNGDQVVVDGRRMAATLTAIAGSPVRQFMLDGRSFALPLEPLGPGRWAVTVHGERHEVDVVDERTRHVRSLTGAAEMKAGPGVLKAPMPGLVVRVQVEAGQLVAPGMPLVILEAMKMENQLKAAAPAMIASIRVAAGQAVEKGQVLIEFAEPGERPRS